MFLKRFLMVRGAELVALGLMATIPLATNNPFLLGLLTLLTIYAILLIGLDVTVGYLGQVNLAQAAFLGLGAYAAGLAATDLGASLPAALGLAWLTGAVLGGLLALPALRLEGPQFALATLSFGALSVIVLNEWESLTQGAQGLQIPRPELFGSPLGADGFYWLCLLLLALVWTGMRNLMAGQWGRAFEALRDSPIATDAMGVGVFRHKVLAFALGSSLGALAGGLYGYNFQYLQPHSFGYELMIILLLGVVLGGRKNLWGAFVGSALVVLLPNLLSDRVLFQSFAAIGFVAALAAGIQALRSKKVGAFRATAPMVAMGILVVGSVLVENTEDWRKAIFALMLFAVVVGLPEGLMGFASQFLSRVFKVPAAPLPPAAQLDAVLPIFKRSGPLLELKGLARYFGGVKAVNDVSMIVDGGSIHGLIGPNGSGKSTLVNVVSGLYEPTHGDMLLNGKALATGSLYTVAQEGVARTFQNLQLFSQLTALDNVMVALKGAYKKSMPLVILGMSHDEEKRAQADALALLALVGLETQARVRAMDLTYGAQRFLEVARALARRPSLLILDEPAAGLAQPDVTRLIEIVKRIHSRGVTIVMIEHHMDVVSELCDRVTVLDGGKVIAEGLVEDVKRDPKVVAAYLGGSGGEH
ncbi:MAG: ABC transporter permease subunit [Fluviibacter sp.]